EPGDRLDVADQPPGRGLDEGPAQQAVAQGGSLEVVGLVLQEEAARLDPQGVAVAEPVADRPPEARAEPAAQGVVAEEGGGALGAAGAVEGRAAAEVEDVGVTGGHQGKGAGPLDPPQQVLAAGVELVRRTAVPPAAPAVTARLAGAASLARARAAV